MKINNGTEYIIDGLKLNPHEKEILSNCISRYAQPTTFCELLTWMTDRIGNAVKNIFGKSDWQKAKKIIHDHTLVIAKQKNIFFEIPKNASENKVNKNVIEMTNNYVKVFLDICLQTNQVNIEVNDEFRKKMAILNLEKFFEPIKKAAVQLLQKA